MTTLTAARLEEAPARLSSLVEGVLSTMIRHNLKVAAVRSVIVALTAGALVVAQGALAARQDPQVKHGAAALALSAPAQADAPAGNDPVSLALKDALPAAITSADPYLMTFALIRLAKAQHASGDAAAALETFRQADTVAGTVKNQHLRRLALMRTAVARGKIGDTAPAQATLEHFAREAAGLGPEARYNLMSMVIDFQFDAGFRDKARANLDKELAAVEAIADEQTKDGGVHRLLYNQITQGDYDGALRQSARYAGEKSNFLASMLEDIMRYRRSQDPPPSPRIVERALELAQEITFPYPQASALREIAAAFARAGEIERGLSVARDIADTPQFPIRYSEIPLALVEIARVQAKAGNQADAKKALREAFGVAEVVAHRDVIHAERVRRVAEAQAEIGDIEGAKASAAAIEGDPRELALARCALARAQAKAGDAAAAQATLREATAAARNIGPLKNMINDQPAANADRVFREIAVAQADSGDAKGAVVTITGRGSDEWRSEALAAVAPIQAQLGDLPGALDSAHSIPDRTRAGEAYSAIASFQARSGAAPAALKWASQLDAPVAKALALIGISEGLAARRAEKRAGKP